eukprot:TRINITY_DN12778_c0_g1_i1.p1 TRINITY_DN12778_c0_g1~~TRINITY_DN12778_c0_g1_i1.p1  ORF type:complete len:1516 (-),score=486.93 TRINITY_DN12778_c0_g1_i1:221-4768(-)
MKWSTLAATAATSYFVPGVLGRREGIRTHALRDDIVDQGENNEEADGPWIGISDDERDQALATGETLVNFLKDGEAAKKGNKASGKDAATPWIGISDDDYRKKASSLGDLMASFLEEEEASKDQPMIGMQGNVDVPASSSATRDKKCEYMLKDNERPKKKNMFAVVPSDNPAAKRYCDGQTGEGLFNDGYRACHVARLTEFTVNDCENMCTTGLDCDGTSCRGVPWLEGAERRCAGYVVRDKFEPGKPNCWLIPGDASRSTHYQDELKMDDLSKFSVGGHKTEKKTFVRESCGCGNRYVHIARWEQATELALLKSELENLVDPDQERREAELAEEEKRAEETEGYLAKWKSPTPPPAPTEEELAEMASERAAYIKQKKRLQVLVDELEAQGDKHARARAMAGVYDYLPKEVPHRIYRGYTRFIPNGLLKLLGTMGLDKMSDQGTLKYWESKVRITHIYKKTDFSSILYKCLDKDKSQEFWYLASRNQLLSKISQIIEVDEESALDVLSAQGSSFVKYKIALFFGLKCIGHRVSDSGQLFTTEQGKEVAVPVFVDPETLHRENELAGCYPNAEDAESTMQVRATRDVYQSIGEEYKTGPMAGSSPKLDNTFCSSLLPTEDKEKMLSMKEEVGGWLKHETIMSVAIWAAEKWYGQAEAQDSALNRSSVDTAAVVRRGRTLINAMSDIYLRLQAISATDDHQVKLFCAQEMLWSIQHAGGIWPKISQNLAMRPDIIPDDFARNKLKETQSGNPAKTKEATMKYHKSLAPKLDLPGLGATPVLDFMEHDKVLSVGSVGQVDVFTLSKAPAAASKVAAFMEKVEQENWKGRKDKFIVKTIFKETHEMYKQDWILMEKIFHMGGESGNIDAKFMNIWMVLQKLEKSIFDEFDLSKEASFTQRGRAMMKEFTDRGMTNGVTVTTPLGFETSSEYIMIQSFAQGAPLNKYLENIKGQWAPLAAWREDIYSTILKVFGYSAIRHGFFQSDPHPGNWFWEPTGRTLSLIDWGGVEDWTGSDKEKNKAHCTLTRLYSSMGKLSEHWNSCDAVVLAVEESSGGNWRSRSATYGGINVTGVYRRSALSVHEVQHGEQELMFGHSYALSYKHESQPIFLWYTGKEWELSKVTLQSDEITERLAYLDEVIDQKVQKADGGKGLPGSLSGPNEDQSFWGRVFGKTAKAIPEGGFKTKWIDPKKTGRKLKLRLKASYGVGCDAELDRTQAYAIAAMNLGIRLDDKCEAHKILDMSGHPLVKAIMHTDDNPIVCLRRSEEKKKDFAPEAYVGVPHGIYDLAFPSSEDNKPNDKKDLRKATHAKIMVPKKDKFGEDAEEEVLVPLTDNTTAAAKWAAARINRESKSDMTKLTADGVGRYFKGLGNAKHGTLSDPAVMKKMVLDQGIRIYAMSGALFDSDVAEAALMAMSARQGLSLFNAGAVPQSFTQFARCVIVFHGMIGDVIKENAMRLMPLQKLQWLLRSWNDRFFETWSGFADEALADLGDTCEAGPWAELAIGELAGGEVWYDPETGDD